MEVDAEESKSPGVALQEKRKEQQEQIRAAEPGGNLTLSVLKEVMVDTHQLAMEVDHLQQMCPKNSSEQELADSATEKLSHMQSYLGEAFNSNLDIVLHESQWGKKEFAIDLLPDVPVRNILYYLELEDKRNLRLVCRRFADRVLFADSKMRVWKMSLYKTDEVVLADEFLDREQFNGKFWLHLEDCRQKDPTLQFLSSWCHNVVSLSMRLDSPLGINLPNLVTLDLTLPAWPEGSDMNAALNTFLKMHTRTLKRLRLGFFFAPKDLTYGGLRAPKLEYLSLCNMKRDCLLGAFDLGKNITALDLGYGVDVMADASPGDFYLPKLRQLRMKDVRSYNVISDNSKHLESLTIELFRHNLGNQNDFQLNLPKIKTFACRYRFEEPTVMQKVFSAAQNSLTTLIIDFQLKSVELLQIVRMDNLKELLVCPLTRWTTKLIQENWRTLELLVVSMERDNQGRVDVVGKLPKLKKIIVLIDDETTLANKELTMKEIEKLGENYKHAEVVIQKDKFVTFVKAHMRSQGIDPAMTLSRDIES
eukprot:TRINITY_DN15588_c0_g1_i13.p1 TRINITY_DN15588_c0_g1~~TRINITY_DN15588_c0_g1_i13.p1  ORF type:complete len:559 (-),score=123.97 TRINITY_DN15588_c0_g1_i13:822-2423(-)